MKKNIVVIEEHNEAFKEVYNFYKLKKEKYTLLHIDEHDDMGSAYVKKQEIDIMDEKSMEHIVYEQLNVGNYIMPLIYKSILENIVWLSNEKIESYCELKTMTEQKNNDFILIKCKKVKPDGKNIGYFKINSSSDIHFMKDKKIIVSLDMDFFGSNDARGEEIQIEISEKEYYSLKKDKYHKLRLGLGSMIYSYKKNGKYYLQIYGKIENEGKNIDKDTIEKRIQKLKDFFYRNCISPELIIICKSFKSGYANDSVRKYIKENYPEIYIT